MTIKDYYLEAEKELKKSLYFVENYKEISYGIQFRISKFDQSHLVRIYNSKRKGVRLDYSQIKHPDVKKDLKEIKNKLDQNYKINIYLKLEEAKINNQMSLFDQELNNRIFEKESLKLVG
jgi:hypothetical protein